MESRHPERDVVMVLFGFTAGLRAGEIAQITWADLTDPDGSIVTDSFTVRAAISKGNLRDRRIPIHPELCAALIRLSEARPSGVHPMYADRGGDMSVNHVTVHLWRIYQRAGFVGASAHSGRCSFITNIARRANLHACSMRDVQYLAGHASIETTENYIEPSDAVAGLVASLSGVSDYASETPLRESARTRAGRKAGPTSRGPAVTALPQLRRPATGTTEWLRGLNQSRRRRGMKPPTTSAHPSARLMVDNI